MSEVESSNSGVYFLSLELENVRCFGKKQKLDLFDKEDKNRPAQWTVILGDNGTGKTTLLESILISKVFKRRSLFLNSPSYLDENEATLQRCNTDGSSLSLCFAYDSIIESKNQIFKNWTNKHSINSDLFERNIENTPPDDFNQKTFFCIAYNANRKLLTHKEELINTEGWLLETHHIANINLKFSGRFELIKNTLINLLPDITNIKVYFPDENKPELKIHFLANNIWLPLNALSLGYQSMIAWVVDLAARLFERYPTSENPIAEPAIVLIDEIDLHLHPKWQREIMRYLSERFTNTQFIVTAHSPLIVQAAEDENANIVVLRREGDEVIIDQQPKAIRGWRVDQLLASDLFGNQPPRSDNYEKWMKERREILRKSHKTDADNKRLAELKEKLGYIPTAESPEDIEAMEFIRSTADLLRAKRI